MANGDDGASSGISWINSHYIEACLALMCRHDDDYTCMTAPVQLPLLPHQEDARDFLVSRVRGYLALEMGLGKTRVVLEAAKELGLSPREVLVLCPKGAVSVWESELRKWWNYDYSWGGESFLAVFSYSMLIGNRAFMEKVLEGRFRLLVMDEAHKLKGEESKISRFVMGISRQFYKMNNGWEWMSSGTPMPNGPRDLYLPMKWGGLTTLERQDWEDYFLMVRKDKVWVKNPPKWKKKARQVIKRQVGGVRDDRKEEWDRSFSELIHYRQGEKVYDDFPGVEREIVELVGVEKEWGEFFPEIFCRRDAGASRSFSELIDYEANIIKKAIEAAKDMEDVEGETPTIRKQVGLSKVEGAARDIVSRLLRGLGKIVVFAWHTDVIELLRREFVAAHLGVAVITGQTTLKARKKAVDSFQNHVGVRVFLGNIKAAGESITLTAADTLAFVEKTWRPGDNLQASFRIRRVGQKSDNVKIIDYVLKDSYDGYVAADMARKEKDLEFALGISN